MKEYRNLPKYANMTPYQARYSYLRDLVRLFQGRLEGEHDPRCRRRLLNASGKGSCFGCPLQEGLSGTKSHFYNCGWAIEANQEKAISIMEQALKADQHFLERKGLPIYVLPDLLCNPVWWEIQLFRREILNGKAETANPDPAGGSSLPGRMHKIADHYGLRSQLAQTEEECAELIQAISKWNRFGGSKEAEHIAEEIADVQIMLTQIVHLLGAEESVAAHMKSKVERQEKRIQEEVSGHARP